MRKGEIAVLESGKEVKLLRSIGGKEQHENDYSQFWEVEDDKGNTDVMLLIVKKSVVTESTSQKEGQ